MYFYWMNSRNTQTADIHSWHWLQHSLQSMLCYAICLMSVLILLCMYCIVFSYARERSCVVYSHCKLNTTLSGFMYVVIMTPTYWVDWMYTHTHTHTYIRCHCQQEMADWWSHWTSAFKASHSNRYVWTYACRFILS